MPSHAPEPKAQPHTAAAVGLGWRHPHYAELLQTRPALDFLEVHSENFFGQGGAALAVLEQGRAHYPVSLHGVGLSLGSAMGLDAWHLDALAALVQRIDPVRVSDHAAFARGQWAGRTVHAADLLPLPFSAEALGVLCDNVQRVQDRLRRPLLVENLSAYVQWRMPAHEQAWAEPEFLNTLAQRTGCQLLVDVNNIYVNARNACAASHGGPGDAHEGAADAAQPLQLCRTWLQAIRPSAVGELHVAGHCEVTYDAVDDAAPELAHEASHTTGTVPERRQHTIIIDDHGSRVCDAVWALYRHAQTLWGPVPTLVEWDTDVPALDVLLAEVQLARQHALEAAHASSLAGTPPREPCLASTPQRPPHEAACP
jgi:uncharacterized protein